MRSSDSGRLGLGHSDQSTGDSTATGRRLSVKSPCPSWPSEFIPKHRSEPFRRSAHVNLYSATTATASEIPLTSNGTFDIATESVPSCPLSFSPQHHTVPSD